MKLSKTSIIAASCLGALAFTGVGFAGWYITVNATKSETGNITVYEITNNTIVLEKQSTDSLNVVFGKPSDATTGADSVWFDFDNTVANESLNPTVTYKMTAYGNAASSPKVTAALKFADTITDTSDALKNYKNCLDNSYIAGPALVDNGNKKATVSSTQTGKGTSSTDTDNNKVTVTIAEFTDSGSTSTDESKKVYTVTVKLGFDWGTHFGSTTPTNPYSHYNSLDDGATPDNIDDAVTAMSAINDLASLSFTLTITAANGATA